MHDELWQTYQLMQHRDHILLKCNGLNLRLVHDFDEKAEERLAFE